MDFSGRAKRHSPLNFVLEMDEEHMLGSGWEDELIEEEATGEVGGFDDSGGPGAARAAVLGEYAAAAKARTAAGGGVDSGQGSSGVFFRLGKLSADEFALDFRAPFSPMVALAVACSAFVRNAKMPV